MEPIIRMRNVTKFYAGGKKALDDVSLEVLPGRIVGMLGPNGCGKTTMFKILAGLIGDASGEILIDGAPIGPHTKAVTSYLPEKTYLSDWMRAKDAINTFRDFYADFDRDRAMAMLERFGLNEKMKLKAMSKGMQEKLQLILVMCRRAKLYLLDEPISGVDPAARDNILDVILENYNPESTILLSTHLIFDVEKIFTDAVFVRDGRIALADSAANIREQSGKTLDEYFREVYR